MRKSKKKLLAMLIAGTMVFGMLPSNAFANNEQDPTSTVVDETVTTDNSAKLEEEGDTNQGTTEVEAPVEKANPQEVERENKTEEALPEGDVNTEVAVDLSLEEIKLQKTEEIKAGEKYIIVYDNKKALSTGKDNIIAVPVEIAGDTVKTEITKNIIWTVDDKGNLTTEMGKYLTADLGLQEKVEEGQSFKFDKKNVSYEENEVNTYLTYNEEKNEWSFEEKENEAVTYYEVEGPVETLEELTEEELDKIEEANKPTEPTEIPADGAEDEVTADLDEDVPSILATGDVYELYTGDITPGKYIIVAESDSYALTNNNDSARKTLVNITDNKITAANNNYIWTFDINNSRYTIKNGNNYLKMSQSNFFGSSSQNMDITEKGNGFYTIKRSNENRYLVYDNGFTYNSTTSNVVRLYKKVEELTLTANFYDYYNQDTLIADTQTFSSLTSGSNSSTVTIDTNILSNYNFEIMTINDVETKELQLNFTDISQNTVVNYYYKDKSSIGETGTSDDIILNKTATNERLTTDGRGYMYDINLSVTGKEITSNNPVDVTIVLDVSNSMTNNSSRNLTNTITAATTFINNTLKVGNSSVRVSFVKYGTNAMVYNFTTKEWISNYSNISGDSNYYTYNRATALTVLDYDTLKGGGGTNTEEGFKAANKVTSIRNRNEAQSIVLFMTDGVPTYSSNSDSKGSNTSVTEFNGAVDAGVALKNAENTVYTIGLLAGMSGTSKEVIADRLLSSNYKYQANRVSGNNAHNDDLENLSTSQLSDRFTSSQPAYSSGYYKVTNSDTAASEMEKIYKDLAGKVLALATGTVTDIIPAEFKLTEESKLALETAGHKVIINENGTTTIVFNGVTAGKEITNLPTFTIEPNTNAYGAKFTNVEATYDYTLYDKLTGTKEFPIPQGFITPLTHEDVYYTTVNSNLTIDDVLNNDPSFNNKLEQGYTVSDLTYRLVDQNGNSISSITGTNGESLTVGSDSKFNFISPVEGTFTFYYVAEGTASNGKVLTSVPTLVTVHVYGIENKVFVIDYGKPVTYSAETVFNKDIEKATGTVITLPESENSDSKCGTLVLNNDKSITYILNRYMDKIDKFNFNVEIENVENPLTKTVTIMPATSVYYEDNFGVEFNDDGTVKSSSGINFSDSWIKVGTTNTGDKEYQNSSQGGNYGYDSSYLSDKEFSNSSAMMITSENNDGTNTATFTFKGTGFDLISRTDNNTGSIIVEVSGENLEKPFKTIVNNKYTTKNGVLYQIPVINFRAEDWVKEGSSSYGEYTVKITVGKTNFYLDAIRVYNPLGFENEEANTQYKADKEFAANIMEVRNLLISSESFNKDNIEGVNGIVYVDTKSNVDDIAIYENIGPNNEVYLENGNAIAFKIDGYENADSIQIGVKVPNTNIIDENVVVNGTQKLTVKTATDMYYDITDVVKNSNGVVTISNAGDNIVSITNIKITSGSTSTTFGIVSDSETIVMANMLAYEASIIKSADIDGSGNVDIYDLANVASNQGKEVIIGVSTDIYRQDLTGTRTIDREDLNIVKDNIK